MTQAIGQGLGIQDIQSPTFTIVREHRDGRLPLFHFDAYRLGSGEELYAIGYEDYLAQQGVVVMEWCENVPEALPAQRLEVHLTGSGMEPRTAVFRAMGPAHSNLLEALHDPISHFHLRPCGFRRAFTGRVLLRKRKALGNAPTARPSWA